MPCRDWVRSAPFGLALVACGGGTEAPNCDGKSVDPPISEIAAATPSAATAATALQKLRPLAERYPLSATVRIHAAGVALHSQQPDLPSARALYAEAAALHDAGCRVTDKSEWSMLEGMGLVEMAAGDFAAAIAPLEKGATRFPDSSSTHYNLACSYCRIGNVDRCQDELAKTLAAASLGPHEPWEGAPRAAGGVAKDITMSAAGVEPTKAPSSHRPAGYYARKALEDPDLAALRADPRFEGTVAAYLQGN